MFKVLLLVSTDTNQRILHSFIALDDDDLNMSIANFILREVQEKHPQSNWTADAIQSIESESGVSFFKMRHCSLREGFFGVPGTKPEQMIAVLHPHIATAPLSVEGAAVHADSTAGNGDDDDDDNSVAASFTFEHVQDDESTVSFENDKDDDEQDDESAVSFKNHEDDDDATVSLVGDREPSSKKHVIHMEDSPPPPKRTKTRAALPIVTPDRAENADGHLKVLSNEEAWDILVHKFGFRFSEDKYCLPGENGTFQSIVDLRNDLCKYGIPMENSNVCATEEELRKIKIWVRFAIVKDLRDGETICTDLWEDMKFMMAWSALGFKYSSGTYYVPVCDPISGSTKFIRFKSTRTVEVENYFARFGVFIPPHSNLDKEARLRIDLFFANRPMTSKAVAEAVNTFERVELDDHGWPVLNRKRASRCVKTYEE